jgi:sialic acid synthase SpsE
LNNIRFIAEIASTHKGNILRLRKIINLLTKSDTDYIKLQIYKNSKLNHKSSRFYKNLKKIEISYNNWKNIINKYHTRKKIILEPFDIESYEFTKKFKDKVFIKISSSEIFNFHMISDAIKHFKKIFLNISGCKDKELQEIIKLLKFSKKRVVFLYGYQSFPSKLKDVRFKLLQNLKKQKFITGYSDHSSTINELETYIATALAITKKVNYIEKHVTIDRHLRPPDFSSSFEINEYQKFIEYFKNIFLLNEGIKQSSDEKNYGKEMHKFAVLNKNVKKGNLINIKDLIFLRINNQGLTLFDVNKIIRSKKKYKKDFLKNETLQ